MGGATYTPTATGGASGNPVIFTIDATASSVCSITAGAVSFQTAGNCVVDANQAGNANYNAATQVQQTFAVGKGAQTVTFTSTAPGSGHHRRPTYTPTATASSGLTPAITVDASASSVCSITAGVVSFQTGGTCVLDANQAGNANYNAAAQVQQTFAVAKASQTVTFTSTAPATGTIGGTYTPTATATSGLTVAITLDASSTGCTLTAGVVHFTATGTCVIDANQAGNASFNAAPQVKQNIAIGLTPQTINFTSTRPDHRGGGRRHLHADRHRHVGPGGDHHHRRHSSSTVCSHRRPAWSASTPSAAACSTPTRPATAPMRRPPRSSRRSQWPRPTRPSPSPPPPRAARWSAGPPTARPPPAGPRGTR